MNATIPFQGSPVVQGLLDEVRAGIVGAEPALKTLANLASTGIVSMDCAHAAWNEVARIIRIDRLEPLRSGN